MANTFRKRSDLHRKNFRAAGVAIIFDQHLSNMAIEIWDSEPFEIDWLSPASLVDLGNWCETWFRKHLSAFPRLRRTPQDRNAGVSGCDMDDQAAG